VIVLPIHFQVGACTFRCHILRTYPEAYHSSKYEASHSYFRSLQHLLLYLRDDDASLFLSMLIRMSCITLASFTTSFYFSDFSLSVGSTFTRQIGLQEALSSADFPNYHTASEKTLALLLWANLCCTLQKQRLGRTLLGVQHSSGAHGNSNGQCPSITDLVGVYWTTRAIN